MEKKKANHEVILCCYGNSNYIRKQDARKEVRLDNIQSLTIKVKDFQLFQSVISEKVRKNIDIWIKDFILDIPPV